MHDHFLLSTGLSIGQTGMITDLSEKIKKIKDIITNKCLIDSYNRNDSYLSIGQSVDIP